MFSDFNQTSEFGFMGALFIGLITVIGKWVLPLVKSMIETTALATKALDRACILLEKIEERHFSNKEKEETKNKGEK